mmetsp:Transcript_59268/g.70721  ORF Transcript_59268/g.70721 Transcript_59268/m.70721 type:complete len:575 (+) Transcript_59268:2-1726(+)
MAPRDTVAGKEMRESISKLRLRAVSRTRDYFLGKIAEIRMQKTNVRMLQVTSLLKYAELNDFLGEAAPDIHAEIKNVYVESMSKTLLAVFRTYQAQLSRLDANVATRHDLIAVEEAALKDMFSSKVNLNKRTDTFFLGSRAEVLDLANSGFRPILAHVAFEEGTLYPYEVIFRSIMQHLMDSATNEFVFTRQFFKETGDDTFHMIFSRTLSLILEQLENYLFNCYDCLGLLLMIKLTHAHRRVMKQRHVTQLDGFFERVTMLLWPRLKMLIDYHLRSVRSANAAKLGGVELHAHYVSRRYAEFTSSVLLILNKGKKQHMAEKRQEAAAATETLSPRSSQAKKPSASDDVNQNQQDSHTENTRSNSQTNVNPGPSKNSAGDMLMQDLTLLMEEIISLLQRLSEDLSSPKRKVVFLINNLDQIICIFQERRVMGKGLARFMDMLMKQRELFVEEELLQNFSTMIAFVTQTEAHMSSLKSKQRLEVNINVVESLVRDFSSSWKKGIEQINKNVLSYFSNFRNGMEILKQVLTQLLLYYTRFQDIIRKVWRSKPPAFCKDLVSTSVILAEIKKYALAI